MLGYVDTHCHIDDAVFGTAEATVSACARYGVKTIINVGCNLKSSLAGMALAEKYDGVFFAAGYHPSDASDYAASAVEINKLLSHEKCVAVGEIGIDYHYGKDDAELQKKVLVEQLETAIEFDLPVSVHSRDATEDTLRIIKEYAKRGARGVIHCFSGSVETAKQYVDLGFMIGFGGTVTFKNAKNIAEVAKAVPTDYILTETDSPYLSPEPFRGRKNSPENIPVICNFLSALRKEDPETFADAVFANACRLFDKIKTQK